MNQIPNNQQTYVPQYNMPLPNGSVVATNNGQMGSVSVSSPNGQSQVYNYPTTSIYDPNSKQAASGVNIYIYNPSGIGGPSSVANATYTMPNQNPTTPVINNNNNNIDQPAAAPIANTPISQPQPTEKKDDKKKTVVDLTDEYIKTLESYLRSPDEKVRKMGIVDLIKRFEEDSSRYDDPALTALLNIALQDKNDNNRLLAMSPIAGEKAHGDENTLQLLKQLQTSNKLYGQEAKMATEALLKTAQTIKEIPA